MRAQRSFLTMACVAGGLAVVLGAFGAHALKARLAPDQLAVFETGVRYQMFHALALFAIAWLVEKIPTAPMRAAGWLFAGGIVLFSGSLYLLSTRDDHAARRTALHCRMGLRGSRNGSITVTCLKLACYVCVLFSFHSHRDD
jgi:uncharacterized membrane protein YgdD (TMEM256/DUF423 family)